MIGITTDVDGGYLRLDPGYAAAVEKAGGIPLLLPPVAEAEEYSSLIHGLLIPGGADLDPAYYGEEKKHRTVSTVSRSRSDFEMSLLRRVLELNKAVLGICYGMQLLNVFSGGSLYQDISAQMPVAINHRKGYHKIVITENSFLAHGAFSVNSSHHQAVRDLGTGIKAIARSGDQIIEAFCREDCHFLVGVQWHPERCPKDALSHQIFDRFIKASEVA